MNRYTIIGLVVGLVVGILIGYQAGSQSSPRAPVVAAGVPQGGAPGAGPGFMPPPGVADDHAQRIAAMQGVVARDPKNVQAWVQLGNDYFDTRQPQKAVEAYGKALEIFPNNPDVLTDQGVMYRELGEFDKAIANFQKANQVDPKHMQSLFNLGVVYAYDKKDTKKATETWNQVIQKGANTPQAQQAQQALAQLKQQGPPR